ncbi:MAG: hypothetical protein AB7G28_26385 [Pirellulales bacterium]
MMTREDRRLSRQARPLAIPPAVAGDEFARWLEAQVGTKRAGKRAFWVTINSQGEITALESQEAPRRLA